MSHSYDVIKSLGKQITLDCGVFISVPRDIKMIQIDRELREL